MVRHKNDYGCWENVDRLPVPGCACLKCSNAADRDAQRSQRRRRGDRGGRSNWTPAGSQPPDVGTVAGTDHVASFKTGGPSGDDTLIADGDYSDDPEGFDGTLGNRGHDHHGPWGSQGRGRYTGPGS
ncbi:hypothetical protein Msi02_36790 [Microbispora siamensis]|uniref:Uncharacterized protein n=1 Tax=Microbispora siamensis TaxID=564413 RepID=A0ABQ4GN84_9ACTN|nr:hypothetical protein Msi02_36790 [Microbispora siamensis]